MRLNPKSFEQTELTSSDSLFESSVMMSAMLSIVRRLSSDGKVENEHYIFTYFEKNLAISKPQLDVHARIARSASFETMGF